MVKISARYLCPSYNVDERILDGEEALEPVFDSLRHVDPNAYPLLGQWCRVQRMRATRMANSLNNDYTKDSTAVWIDSIHCIHDGVAFIATLRTAADTLQALSARFEQLEKERVEREQQEKKALARAASLRQQIMLDNRLTELKDSIRTLHRAISSTCDGDGITDREKLKQLKDIFYAYLAVYNRYDVSDPTISESHLARLSELHDFQTHLSDSLLGPYALTTQLENFKETLHTRSGKEHNDVYKSYLRVFKKINLPVNFHNIAEYEVYISQLQELIEVSYSYIDVIDLRDTIAEGTATLTRKCSKRHRDILYSYRELLSELNSVPSYASKSSGEKFITSLHDFIDMQEQYSSAVDRVDVIGRRGDSIVAICPRALSDVVTAYRDFANATDLVPRFINSNSSERYHQTLDNFEQVQQLYFEVIRIRLLINKRSSLITSDRNAPRGLVSGYRHLTKYTNFTPNFATPRGANDMIRSLNHFIEVQDKFMLACNNNATIVNNSKQLRSAFSQYLNIYRAYERILDSYDYSLTITGEADLNSFLKHQEQVLKMQSKFVNLAGSLEKEEYNNRLKRVREIDKIRLIMGL